MLRKVEAMGIVNVKDTVSKYKRNKNQGKEKEWREKVMHGQYLRDKTGVDWERTWQWVTNGDLKAGVSNCCKALFVNILAKFKNCEFFQGQMVAKYHFGLKMFYTGL